MQLLEKIEIDISGSCSVSPGWCWAGLRAFVMTATCTPRGCPWISTFHLNVADANRTQSDCQRGRERPLVHQILFSTSLLLFYLGLLPCLLLQTIRHISNQLFPPIVFATAANSRSLFLSSTLSDAQLALAFRRCQGKQGLLGPGLVFAGCQTSGTRENFCTYPDFFPFQLPSSCLALRPLLDFRVCGESCVYTTANPEVGSVVRACSERPQQLTSSDKLLGSADRAEVRHWREHSYSQNGPLKVCRVTLSFALAFQGMEFPYADVSLIYAFTQSLVHRPAR